MVDSSLARLAALVLSTSDPVVKANLTVFDQALGATELFVPLRTLDGQLSAAVPRTRLDDFFRWGRIV